MNQARLLKLTTALALLFFGMTAGLLMERYDEPPRGITGPAYAALSATGDDEIPQPEAETSPPQTSDERETPVVRTVREVSPAVVTVGAEKRQVIAQPWLDNFFIRRYRYFERTNRIPYMGSGFLIDRKERLVITNYHVIEESDSVFVTFPDGTEIDAEVIDADKYIDIALLRLNENDIKQPLPPALQFAEGEDLELMIGEQVMAIGNPFGNLIDDSQPTVTVGYVSAKQRDFRPDLRNERVYTDMIQTDAAINPGNSGGPLVNIHGKVVGMNTFIFSPSGGSTGIGFAIPADRIKTFIEEIRNYGGLRPLLLDFDFTTIRARDAAGVRITAINKGGPAENAGLQPGDVILEADGKPISGEREFYLLFASRQVGETLTLDYWRDGEMRETEYTVREAEKTTSLPGLRI